MRIRLIAASVIALVASLTAAFNATPISDLAGFYLDAFQGGLYEGGSNEMPSDHAAVGTLATQAILPRDLAGTPSPTGKYVLLSIGMSNTNQEWCNPRNNGQCREESFMALAAADPAVNHQTLVIVNGAQSSKDAREWDSPTEKTYDIVRTDRLKKKGVTELQVQAVWLKTSIREPSISLPAANADAYQLEAVLADTLRAIHVRYPHIQQVWLSSRIYAGYSTVALNPEPYAYETGFAVKWLIEAQIAQRRTGTVDPVAGDVLTAAPWAAWSAYLWANGATPRSDGLTWLPTDFAADGVHPSQSGITKVATRLLAFFKTEPLASCWFLAGQSC